ncbi:putative C-type lectin domain family 17 [Triplophysa rosa]|uniref:C-type lectin domain family 17 n=1 Tax=Triplophysa rosa TaxID=992332 RepID=A0A9W7T7J8_TRIRA|nr:putative C-type lectin domain family 17 [Triplophysa rosa]
MEVIYDNDIMNRESVERVVEIYDSGDYLNYQDFRTETNTQHPVQWKGSESMRIRVYRSVIVCMGLLCILLVTFIVMFVLINANSHQCHNETSTEDRDQLLTKDTNLTKDDNTNLTEQLLFNDTNLTKEMEVLIFGNKNLSYDKDKLKGQMKNLQMYLGKVVGWIYYQFSFYHISTKEKSWDDSRSYCKERGADLIIINNKEEQGFIQKMSNGRSHWIGLSDSDEEGRWKWVDNSTLISGSWWSGEPNGQTKENCGSLHLHTLTHKMTK